MTTGYLTGAAGDRTASRKLLIVMLFLTCTLNFADRAVFSALAQTIKGDLQLSDLQLGLLQGLVFALLYALAGLPLGWLADRVPRTRIIAAATVIWSAATAATGIAGSFLQLAAARLTVGLGEAGFVPPSASLVSDVVPRDRRASHVALVMLGTPVGTLAGAILAGTIAAHWGWRAAFLTFAVPGFVVAALLLALVPEPRRGQSDPAGAARPAPPPFREFLAVLARTRPLQWVIAGGSLAGFGMTSISQFMAMFLARTHHLSVREAATAFGLVSGLSISFGLLVGSFGTDLLARRDPRWPAWGAAIGLACAPPLYWAAFFAPTIHAAFALLLAAGGLLLLFYGPTTGMIQNLLPPQMRGSGVALYTLLYTLIGSGLGPVFVGGMSDRLARRAFAGDYAAACPHGLPPAGADAAHLAACSAASATGLQWALALAVIVFLAAAACFARAAPGLRAAAAADHTSA